MNPLATSSKKIHPLRFVKRRSRQGLTLVELLIAVSLTLIIVAAMIRAFKSTGDSISLGRAKMDMHNKIRVVTETLRRDLQNATHVPNPRAGTSEGYFEIVEGPETDSDHSNSDVSFIGDHDDILALTVKSEGEPFRGQYRNENKDLVLIESYLAEVVWFVVRTGGDDYNGQFNLYRRVLLIRPDLTPYFGEGPLPNIDVFFQENDLSVRYNLEEGLVANSLQDLAARQNRYSHNVAAFPYEILEANLARRVFGNDPDLNAGADVLNRLGQDLMLNNCVGFDIKVFDPKAFVSAPSIAGDGIGQVIETGDTGFDEIKMSLFGSIRSFGGYVDLGYLKIDTPIFPPTSESLVTVDNDSGKSWFSGPSNFVGGQAQAWSKSTYCTWWNGYETDGENQNLPIETVGGVTYGNAFIDEGADGVDNNGDGIIDDNLERETVPPYAYPVRSLEVRVRMIEKKSNQILQQTVRESFVPN